jgi:hypothetical protein
MGTESKVPIIRPVERENDEETDYYAARRLSEREALAGALALIVIFDILILLSIVWGIIAAWPALRRGADVTCTDMVHGLG